MPSVWSQRTGEARVSTTSASRMATPPAAIRLWAPPTVTWKAPGAGTEPASRGSSKLTTSVVPFDCACWNDGGPVMLCSAASRMFATRLPAASRNAVAHSAAP